MRINKHPILENPGDRKAIRFSFEGKEYEGNPFRRQGIDSLCIANAMWDIHSENEYTDTDSMASVTEIVKKLMIVRQKEE